MAQVRVIVDSTSDLPPEVTERLGISVVPLNVHFGDETYQDGVEISADGFLQKLSSTRQMPKTSQPSPEQFRKAYEAAASDASAIVVVTISGKLSGTYNSAAIAAREFSDVPVRVIDSKTASMAAGFPAMAAAEASTQGASLDEVERVARDMVDRAGLLFYVNTLEFLQRGGRIGRAAGLVGSILDIKPVLTVKDGEVEQHQRARTLGKAVQALLDWANKRPAPERVAVIWSDREAELNRLLDGLSARFPREQIIVTKYGPVLGTHLGPGGMGLIVVDGKGGA